MKNLKNTINYRYDSCYVAIYDIMLSEPIAIRDIPDKIQWYINTQILMGIWDPIKTNNK